MAVRRGELLGELAEAGLELAQALTLQVRAATDLAQAAARRGEPPPPVPNLPADPGLAFSRISRAVRLTLALQEKMVDEVRQRDQTLGRRRHNETLDEQKSKPDRVARLLGRVMRAESDDPDSDPEKQRIGLVINDAWERLEDEDRWGHLLNRPVGEILAQICKDLGLSPDYSRWISEAWAGDAIAAFEGEKHNDPESLTILGRDRSRSDQGGASDYAAGASDGLGTPSTAPKTPTDDPEPP